MCRYQIAMLKVYCILIFLISVVLAEKTWSEVFHEKFRQREYKMNFERVELYRYTKIFYNNISLRTFKYNRTSPVVNFTFSYTIEIGKKLEVPFSYSKKTNFYENTLLGVAQAYRFASNEYRLFPLRFQINICTAMKANMGGIDEVSRCGNITDCNFHKNQVYHICNWAPNQYRFPPGVPTGKYMAEMQLYLDEEVFVLRGYGEISRPPPIPN